MSEPEEPSTELDATHVEATTEADDVAIQPTADLSAVVGVVDGWAEGDGSRYVEGGLLGEGGMGTVLACQDTRLGRTVAMKRTHRSASTSMSARQRFEREALITAQLEHPGVPPVYDAALSANPPFYTMRIVGQRTLRDALEDGLTLHRLCQVLIQVCNTMAFAHERGILHRDLKPENIVLGEYGEVYVVDWGLARIVDDELFDESAGGSDLAVEEVSASDIQQLNVTRVGAVVGTVGYMSPEQAAVRALDGRSDLFSIGVILYEGLVGRRPHQGVNSFAKLLAAQAGAFAPPLELEPGTPLLLNALCCDLLSPDPERRPADARMTAGRLQDFLGGVEERKRKAQEARRLVTEATALADQYQSLLAEAQAKQEGALAALQTIEPWQGAAAKRDAWAAEQEAEATTVQAAVLLAEAVERFTQALGYDPNQGLARDGLAELYFELFERAEDQGNNVERARYEKLVRAYDLGRWVSLLEAPATVHVQTTPCVAELTVQPLREKDRTLSPVGEPLQLTTPTCLDLAPGRYLLTLQAADHVPARIPLTAKRDIPVRLEVPMVPLARLGPLADELVYIPGGPAIVGGDDEAFAPLPRQVVHVNGFAMARLPVTFGAYCAFLNALETAGEPIDHLLPKDRTSTYVRKGPDGWESSVGLEDEAHDITPDESALPVFAIDWRSAWAYIRWLSERTGLALRLPREIEWEKAGRGTSGRLFPWGNQFDASLCRMRNSRPWFAQPEGVGTFETDVSAYGVRDLAASTREWMADDHQRVSAVEARGWLETPASSDDKKRRVVVRGGGWSSNARSCHLASRSNYGIDYRNTDIGFRYVLSVDDTNS